MAQERKIACKLVGKTETEDGVQAIDLLVTDDQKEYMLTIVTPEYALLVRNKNQSVFPEEREDDQFLVIDHLEDSEVICQLIGSMDFDRLKPALVPLLKS